MNRKFVTNIFNFEGTFGIEDPMAGENSGIAGDPDVIGFAKVYPSFFRLAECVDITINSHNAVKRQLVLIN
jgi:hypothetical protein